MYRKIDEMDKLKLESKNWDIEKILETVEKHSATDSGWRQRQTSEWLWT